MGSIIWFGFRVKLLQDSHPIAFGLGIFSVDPCTGGHQLKGENHYGSSQTKTGKDFDQAFACLGLIIVFDLGGRHLRRRREGSSERLSRGLKLDGCLG